MRAADLLVLASDWETLSSVLLEAQASGLPAVAPAVGGIPEALRETAGVLVEPGDPRALADGIEAALDRSFDRDAIAREVRERFGPEAIAARWDEVYAEAERARVSRVLVISFSDLGRDARVDRQIGFLRERHEVVAAGLAPSRHPVEFVDLAVEPPAGAFAPGRPRAARRAPRSPAAATPPTGASPLHRAAAERLAGTGPDLVLANDVEALPLAMRVAGAAPVLFDAHEWAIAQYEQIAWWRLLGRPQADALLRAHLPHVAGMMTVAPGIAAMYERRYGVRCAVVTNAAPHTDLEPGPVGSPVRLLHHGAANPVRQLELMIEAVDRLDGRMTLDLALLPERPRVRGQAAGARRRDPERAGARADPAARAGHDGQRLRRGRRLLPAAHGQPRARAAEQVLRPDPGARGDRDRARRRRWPRSSASSAAGWWRTASRSTRSRAPCASSRPSGSRR